MFNIKNVPIFWTMFGFGMRTCTSAGSRGQSGATSPQTSEAIIEFG